MGTTSKKMPICTNCKWKGHPIENCWAKGGEKEGQGLKQKRRSRFRKKKGKEKANAAGESSSDGKSDELVAFINSDCVAFIKDSTGATVIIDMGASCHMTPHKNLLKNYQSFSKPRSIRGANKGTFDALGTGHLKLSTQIRWKTIDICYKYQLSHLHIHRRLCRKSPRSIRRSILRIQQPTNHPIVIICTPCIIPEPI